MGNIVGEGFPNWLINQIDVRQKVYGTINKTNDELLYLNGRTGWCKLVSSVDIEQVIRNIPADTNVSKLASQFVLFNGTYNEGTNQQKAGIWPGEGNFNNYAYGIGGTEFGLRPMPGIIQATVKTETRGSLKTATVNIKANSRQQFDIIDLLYLRLGFNMLLEWGHSSYFDNNGVYRNEKASLADAFLTKKYAFTWKDKKYTTVDYQTMLYAISEKREATNGNYDAIVGKVVNFNWTFTKDGTYDITLILRSLGDVIESLKTNILLPAVTPINDSSSDIIGNLNKGSSNVEKDIENKLAAGPESKSEVIVSFKDAHEIARDFYRVQQLLQSKPVDNYGAATTTAYTTTENIDYYKQNYQGDSTQYYVRFGRFLELIQNRVIPNVDDDNIKLLNIDTDIESNILLLGSNYQDPSDPRICTYYLTKKNKTLVMANGCEPFRTIVNGKIYGKIMNLYFNMAWILTTMNDLKDDKGKVNLYDILKAVCDGYNNSTGNFNQIEPVVEEETNTIRIVDQIYLPDKDYFLKKQGLPTDVGVFQIYGYNSDKSKQTIASFVRDFSFNTTITNNFSTMITIGSTANGYVIGSDSTALARMNNGLKDRFKEEIYHKEAKIENPPNTGSLEQDYKDVIVAFNKYSNSVFAANGKYPKLDIEAIDAFKSLESQIIEYDQAKQTQTKQNDEKAKNNGTGNIASPNSGFLPFDLSLTIDGLSGIKIYQAMNIDITYLPANYPTSLDFLIKGVTHTIQNNTWLTQLETMAVPKNPFGSGATEGVVETASRRPSTVDTGTPVGTIPPYVIDNTLLDLSKFLYPTSGTITSKVAMRAPIPGGVKGSNQHRAMDIGATKGTPVYSSTAGKVVKVGASGYGPNAVYIQIDKSFYKDPNQAAKNPFYIIYGHMDTSLVKSGQIVTAGQQIGTVGDKDSPGAFHLHYQIKNNLGFDSAGLSINTNDNFPAKSGKITAKQKFITA